MLQFHISLYYCKFNIDIINVLVMGENIKGLSKNYAKLQRTEQYILQTMYKLTHYFSLLQESEDTSAKGEDYS